VVMVNRMVDAAAASVASDVAHLVELGHTAIAHVTGPAALSMTQVRRTAFEEAMRAAGLSADPELVETAERYAVGRGQPGLHAPP
jgi:LacI family transcriptional regulator